MRERKFLSFHSLRLNRLRVRLILYIVVAVLPLAVLSFWLTATLIERDVRLARAEALLDAQRVVARAQTDPRALWARPEAAWAVYDAEGQVIYGGGAIFPGLYQPEAGDLPQVVRIPDSAGRNRHYGMAPLPGGEGAVLALPRGSSAGLRHAVLWTLPLLATLLGLSLALLSLRRLIVKPVERLALRMTAREALRPDRDDPAQILPDELRAIETRVNAMVTRINVHNARLQQNVDQKNTLLRELHHRVRNNLQVTSSMLNLRMRRLKPGGEAAMLNRFHASLRALATVQDQMFAEGSLSGVDMQEALGTVLATVKLQRDRTDPVVPVKTRLDKVVLTADQAMPLALAATESLCDMIPIARNGGGRPAPVEVALTEKDGVVELVFSTPHEGPEAPETDATRLIDILAFQLEAEFGEGLEDGTYVHRLRFASDGGAG